MTHHGHDHQHGHSHDHSHNHPTQKKGLHRDWRVWMIVILMLLGMFLYVATLDESMMPWAKPGPRVPADVAP